MDCRQIKEWRKELDRVLLEMRDALWNGPIEEEYCGAVVGGRVEDIVFFTAYKKKWKKTGNSVNKLNNEVNALL